MTSLTVIYDEGCALCRRCREWMLAEPSLVPVVFVAAGSDESRRRFGSLPWVGSELVVVDDDGLVWVGPGAFLVCLWALAGYRELSYTLSGPLLAPFAERFFRALSSQRGAIAAFLDSRPCGDGACSVPCAATRPYR